MNAAIKTMAAADKKEYSLDARDRKYEREKDKREAQDRKDFNKKVFTTVEDQSKDLGKKEDGKKLAAGLASATASAIAETVKKNKDKKKAQKQEPTGTGGPAGISMSPREVAQTPTRIEPKNDHEERLIELEKTVFSFPQQKAQKLQSGGFAGAVPNLGQPGTGDHFYTHVQPGSYVLNRNAVAAMGFQGGGNVPVALEQGEIVIPPGQYDQKMMDVLNYAVAPRFQNGGNVSQSEAGASRSGSEPEADPGSQTPESVSVSTDKKGIKAIIQAAESSTGLSAGVSEQCANTTRAVLAKAGHPAANKTTKVGDLDPEGLKYNGPGFAASFAGSDMGSVTTSISQTKPGSIMLWRDTYGNFAPGAITHVGIAGEGNTQYDHGSGPGWRKRSRDSLANKFAYGIDLNGQATGKPDETGNDEPSGQRGTPAGGDRQTIPQQEGSKGVGGFSGPFAGILSAIDKQVFQSAENKKYGVTLSMLLGGEDAFSDIEEIGAGGGNQDRGGGGNQDRGGDTPSGGTPSGDTPSGDTPSGGTPSGDSTPTSFKSIYNMAKAAGAKYPELVAAQWQLESAGGTAISGKNNFFGIKAAPGEASTIKKTWEVINGQNVTVDAAFKDYATPQDSVNDLVKLWHKDYKGYIGANNAKNARAAADYLRQQGYATDPAYSQKLKRIMKEHGYRQGGAVKKQSGAMVGLLSKVIGVDLNKFFENSDRQLQLEALSDEPEMIQMGDEHIDPHITYHESGKNTPDYDLPTRDYCPLSVYYRYHPSLNPQGMNP